MEGATYGTEEGFVRCQGPIHHPVCNFACDLNLNPWAVGRLREIATERSEFCVYSFPDDLPAHRSELLELQGFRPNYRLTMMVAEPSDPGPFPEMRLAVTPEQKQQVAEFMANQFPGRLSSPYRADITAATTSAEGLDLFDLTDRGGRAGAVMLCRSDGVIGAFNLCVAGPRRGRGIGQSIVAWLRAMSWETQMPLSLQCDATLEAWYEYLGFSRVGWIDVYVLDKIQRPDIMN